MLFRNEFKTNTCCALFQFVSSKAALYLFVIEVNAWKIPEQKNRSPPNILSLGFNSIHVYLIRSALMSADAYLANPLVLLSNVCKLLYDLIAKAMS